MATHLVIGAGPIGHGVAQVLVKRGEKVKVMTRSGTAVPGCETVMADAADRHALQAAAAGCASMIVCTNPQYHRWQEDWPPVVEAVVEASKSSGARVVLMSNLYAYGQGSGVMDQHTPVRPTSPLGQVRAQLWQMLVESGVDATELRASDYFGPGAGKLAHAGDRLVQPIKQGRTAWVFGNPQAKHSWSYLPDIAECLAILATSPQLSGQYWIGPISGNASLQEFAELVLPRAKVRQLPRLVIKLMALFSPMMKAVLSGAYMHDEQFIADDSAFRAASGFRPTPLAEAF